MAEEKKTNTRGRKPKTTTTINKNDEQNSKDIINDLIKKIEEQNNKMAELQKQLDESKQPLIVQQTNDRMSAKKVKVINLMHNALNISTEPNGSGRVYSFEKYGDSRFIKFDDLVDILSSYPYTMENGLAYICDKDVVAELGLSDEYENLFGKEIMDKVIWLRTETELELFLGMNKDLQESTAIKIAELINNNERMDYNFLREIKDKTNIDIEKIANDIKELNKKLE